MRSPEYVLHGTSSSEGSKLIEEEGFKTKEGFPNISENLIYAFEWATQKERAEKRHRAGTVEDSASPGRIFIMNVPEGIVVKYGNLTERNIDDEKKQITGHIKNYTSGRNQLAFYRENDEDSNPGEQFSPGAEIVLSVTPSEELGTIINNLKNEIRNVGKIDTNEFSNELADVFMKEKSNKLTREETMPILLTLTRATVESEIMRMMRVLELNVYRAKGYKTFNNSESIDDWQFVGEETLRARLASLKEKASTFDTGNNTEPLRKYIRSGADYLLQELGE